MPALGDPEPSAASQKPQCVSTVQLQHGCALVSAARALITPAAAGAAASPGEL